MMAAIAPITATLILVLVHYQTISGHDIILSWEDIEKIFKLNSKYYYGVFDPDPNNYYETKEVRDLKLCDMSYKTQQAFIAPFITSPTNCLMVVTNLMGVQIHSTDHPFVLFRPKLNLEYNHYDWRSTKLSLQGDLGYIIEKRTAYKRLPSFRIEDVTNWTVDPKKFQSQSKPWNCYVDVTLFPTANILGHVHLTKKLVMSRLNSNCSLLPSTVPWINILVSHDKQDLNVPDRYWGLLSAHVTLHHSTAICIRIISKNDSIHLYQISFHNEKVQLQPLTKQKLCRTMMSLSTSVTGSPSDSSVITESSKSMSNAFNVWTEIVGNWTVKLSSWSWVHYSSFDHLKLTIEADIVEGKLYTPYIAYFEDYQVAMRFVTCNPKGVETLPYSQLFAVFDVHIWECILLSMLSLSVLLMVMEQNPLMAKLKAGKIHDHFFSTVKVLVEQEYPFPAKITGITRLRLLIGAYLLMGVVLSNGYKNTNVFILISPRKPALYRTFHDLMEERNFSVFSRSILGFMNTELYQWIHEWNDPEKKHGTSHYTTLWRLFESQIEYSKNYLQHDIYFTSTLNTEVADRTTFYSKLVPVYNHTVAALNQLVVAENIDIFSNTKIQAYAKWLIRSKEDETIYQELGTCKNSAFVLEDKECHVFASKLQRENFNRVVSVGEETYFNQHVIFNLKGIINPAIIKRINSVNSAGIWTKVARNGSVPFSLNSDVPFVAKQASLSGNIFVVFLVLFSGLSTSLISLLLETRSSIWMSMGMCWYRVKDAVQNFRAFYLGILNRYS